jgi:hypothetical protein
MLFEDAKPLHCGGIPEFRIKCVKMIASLNTIILAVRSRGLLVSERIKLAGLSH